MEVQIMVLNHCDLQGKPSGKLFKRTFFLSMQFTLDLIKHCLGVFANPAVSWSSYIKKTNQETYVCTCPLRTKIQDTNKLGPVT